MLAARSASEVPSADHDIAGFYIFYKFRIDIFHAVGCKFLSIRRIQVTGRNDDIGIDIVRIFKDGSLGFFHDFFLPFLILNGSRVGNDSGQSAGSSCIGACQVNF